MGQESARSALVWELAEHQDGVVGHEQLNRLGYNDDAIEHRVTRLRLHPIFRGVYAVGRIDLPDRGRWRAAVLATGPVSALSHRSAAALWGFGDGGLDPVDVSVDAWHRRHPGIRCHRRTPMPGLTEVGGIPVTTPEWTLVDLASQLKLEPLTKAANEADKLGILDHDEFVSLVESLKGRRGIRKLRLLLHLDPTDSNLERRFIQLIHNAGLPEPESQEEVHGFRVDCFWPARKLIVETDGLTFHRTPAEQAADRKRDQILTRNGFTVVRFTNAQVRLEPQEVLKTMRVLLKER